MMNACLDMAESSGSSDGCYREMLEAACIRILAGISLDRDPGSCSDVQRLESDGLHQVEDPLLLANAAMS